MSDIVTFPTPTAALPQIAAPADSQREQDHLRRGPVCTITAQVIAVQFPNGYWTSPGMDLCLADGRTQREAAIDGLAQALAQGLRRCLST